MAPKAPENRPQPAPMAPELAVVVAAWAWLPAAIRRGILAIIEGAGQ